MTLKSFFRYSALLLFAGLSGALAEAETAPAAQCANATAIPDALLPLPFEDPTSGKWGYQTPGGSVALPPRFPMAMHFLKTGIAAVVDPETMGWAYINPNGKILLRPFMFDYGPDYFEEGLARYVEDGKMGFFDKRGCVIIRAQFDAAFPFADGRAAVCNGCALKPETPGDLEHLSFLGGLFGYVDKAGKVVIPLRYESAESFKDGKAIVSLDGNTRIIDRTGAFID